MMTRPFLATAGFILLTSCAVGPDYARPQLDIAEDFGPDHSSEVTETGSDVVAAWWDTFEDPTLSRLVRQAAAFNLDIAEAEARVREARALRAVVRGGFFPDVGGEVSYTEQRLSRNGRQLSFAPPGVDDRLSLYSSGFDASWELDLFGKNRREAQAAQATYDSAIERRRAVTLSAVAETVRNYIELRGVQRELAITRRNADSQAETRDLVARQQRVGVASRLDLVRAEANLSRTQAQLPRLEADIRSTIYRISVLTGDDPQVLYRSLSITEDIPSPPTIVPLGLRSDILRRRADVREAERQLAASTAEIGSAVADLFPSVTLFGSGGFEAISTNDLFDEDSVFWSVGPQIRIPIFNGGVLRARVKVREAQADQALIAYERTVLTALEETERSLTRYTEGLKTRVRYTRAVEQQREAAALLRQRYDVGESDFLAVLDTERQLLDLEQELVRSETEATTQLVALYKALGGGWVAFEPGDKEQIEQATTPAVSD